MAKRKYYGEEAEQVTASDVAAANRMIQQMRAGAFDPASILVAVPKPVLKSASLYIADNGACYCGAHCGHSARFSGRDTSGQEVLEVTPDVQAYAVEEFGAALECETCAS